MTDTLVVADPGAVGAGDDLVARAGGPWQHPPMSSTLTTAPVDPKELRPLLHAEIDRLRDEHLQLAHRLLLEIELQQVTDELDATFDEARASGRLTPERIADAIAAHRAAHPYHG